MIRTLILLCLFWAAPAAADPPPKSIFLVAAGKLGDPNFSRSVVLVTQHGAGGPIGVILNRPTDTTVGSVFPDADAIPAGADRIFFGGPVASRMIVFLFRASTPPANSLEVLPGLYLSFDAQLLSGLLREKGPKPDLRIFAGYAGWGRDQLETEIARGDWHPIAADADLVFNRDAEKLWLELIRRASARSVRYRESELPADSLAGRPRLQQAAMAWRRGSGPAASKPSAVMPDLKRLPISPAGTGRPNR